MTDRYGKIITWFRPEMVPGDVDPGKMASPSPLKPGKLMAYLKEVGLIPFFQVVEDWEPLGREDLLLAHSPEYVDAYLNGKEPLCESSWLIWTPGLADSVRYTNASLYQAIRHSLEHPETVALSPTSGFHHATPGRGDAYCTFSGQVIAALKLYREKGVSGAFLDLDAHFGNSLEGSRAFAHDLNLAVPIGANINPAGEGQGYLNDLQKKLQMLKEQILARRIHYVVFCHGADSHENDPYGGQLSTEQWLEASRIVYGWVKEMDAARGEPLPLSLSLFGGYQHMDFVLALHASDLAICLETLCKVQTGFRPEERIPRDIEPGW